jgi:hypothetical protein
MRAFWVCAGMLGEGELGLDVHFSGYVATVTVTVTVTGYLF